MLPEPHPDRIPDWAATKAIQRGGMQALEDKAIAEYMKAYETVGKEDAEKIFFNHFNKGIDGMDKRKRSAT